MKTAKPLLFLFIAFTMYQTCFSQGAGLLETLPTTKEEFISTEKNVFATINWLKNTPLNQEVEKHQKQYAYLTAWITNSPTVTIEINANILTFTKKNSDLLIFFMAGWTKYALENNYSTDKVKGNLAGLRSVIRIYKKGVAIKQDKEVDKLVEMEEKGTLEKWVKEQLAKT